MYKEALPTYKTQAKPKEGMGYLKETDRHMILVEKEGCVEKVVGKEGPLASRAKNNPDPEEKLTKLVV